jgi:hypothetical protein
MTNSDMETMRAVIREELAPVMTRLDSLGGTIDTMHAYLDTMRADLDAVRYLDAVRPNIDGIPLLAAGDLGHAPRHEPAARRHAGREQYRPAARPQREMQAVHRQIASIASRVRKLEGVEE